jgi:putative endonuclease
MFYVYVLKSPVHGQIYIGFSADLRARMKSHNEREHPGWLLVYYEAYRDEEDARERERMLKQYGSSLGRLKKRIDRRMDLLEFRIGGGSSASKSP